MTNNEWKLKEKNGWKNWYTWAANLWATSNEESKYYYFRDLAQNLGLESFKYHLKDFIKNGGVTDFEPKDIEPAFENIDYKNIYEGLRE